MITGNFSALDPLLPTPPAMAAVHLLLPYMFTVRPFWLGRRVAGLADVSALAGAITCRRHVRLRQVAEAELPVLRAILVDADRPDSDSAGDWAASYLQEAEAALRSGQGAAAVWHLHSAAKLLSGSGDRGEADRRAAEVRDRLQAAGQQHRVFDTRSPGYHSTV